MVTLPCAKLLHRNSCFYTEKCYSSSRNIFSETASDSIKSVDQKNYWYSSFFPLDSIETETDGIFNLKKNSLLDVLLKPRKEIIQSYHLEMRYKILEWLVKQC